MKTLKESRAIEMPAHFFATAETVDLASAVRANVSKQTYDDEPRPWYLSATFRCADCGDKFEFTVTEQRLWFEDLNFPVDTTPTRCRTCRRKHRDAGREWAT